MNRAGTLLAGAVVAILVAERFYPRRRSGFARSRGGAEEKEEAGVARFARCASTSSSLRASAPPREPTSCRRLTRNAVFGILAMAVIEVVERPVMAALTRRFGRTNSVAAFLLLDYSMHLWHVATHRVPPLWRIHRVHHIDPALDASTALRFHMIDMAMSLPVRAAQAILIRPTPATFALWRRFFFLSVLFHHSNIRLAPELERRLSWLLTTPAMHDIHHSATRDRTGSNWSSGLSVWDRLHGSFRLDTDLGIPIGVPAYPASDAAMESSLCLPFMPHRDDWSPA